MGNFRKCKKFNIENANEYFFFLVFHDEANHFHMTQFCSAS